MDILQNPKVLSEQLQKAVSTEVAENLALGIPVYYHSNQFPDKTIKLMPNGDRFFVQLDNQYNEIISGPVH